MFAKTYLYFQPVTYESSNIIELKQEQNKKITSQAILFDTIGGYTNDDINKQMELIKTYPINKLVVEQLNFDVQYFKKSVSSKLNEYDRVLGLVGHVLSPFVNIKYLSN